MGNPLGFLAIYFAARYQKKDGGTLWRQNIFGKKWHSAVKYERWDPSVLSAFANARNSFWLKKRLEPGTTGFSGNRVRCTRTWYLHDEACGLTKKKSQCNSWALFTSNASTNNVRPRREVDMHMPQKNMLSVKHTTPNPHFTKHCWWLEGPRRRSPMLCTGITLCQAEQKTHILLRSSRHEVQTGTKIVLRATRRPRTGTPEVSTRLSMTFPTSSNASMTQAYGQTLSKKASFRHVAG